MAKDTAKGSVDLGLSVKWAEGNIIKNGTEYSIGAPTDQGCYFSWGNVEGHNYGEGYDFSQSTYESTPGYSLTGDISATSGYDAARVTLGGNWRLPTEAECQELVDNCTWTWVNQHGVNGMMLTSKKSGYTSNSIFIPAAGFYDGTSSSFDAYNSFGIYWSSTWEVATFSNSLTFYSSRTYVNTNYKYSGLTIRPVQ